MTSSNLSLTLSWLHDVLCACLSLHYGQAEQVEVSPLKYVEDGSPLANFIQQNEPTSDELIVLLLALAPHLRPGMFREAIASFLPDGGEFPEFGGVKAANHRDILPTGETAQFILAGNDLGKRLEVQQLFSTEHWFHRKNILRLEGVPYGEPAMSGRILLDPEMVELLTLGKVNQPRFSTDFPAEHISTELEWDDLVLPKSTLQQIFRIESWVKHQHTFFEDWGMNRRVKPGYRVLFHGPPGTGKTLTATLLAKATGLDVFKIDLSMVVSKYIGETEKNLSRLFDKAQNKNWILFFDEADALFGKRTNVRDAHDKYANQEVSYLLQRIETFPGLVILASNFKSNIDDAFQRRFQSIIYFPMPSTEERRRLWEQSFPAAVSFEPSIDWRNLSDQYELTGANIMNIVQQSCINALAQDSKVISMASLTACIREELVKGGKMV